MNRTKASVAIFAYNHAKFVEEAIASVLAQQTDFDFEVVIGEDCSTDGTRAIVRRYRDKFPNRIRLLLNETNLGDFGNFAHTVSACRGEYMAILDGDDYWTCSQKLQRQVDFLDAHPDYSICFHNAMMIWDDGSHPPTLHSPPTRRPTYDLEELLVHDFISTGSVVVRRGLVKTFPDWWWRAPFFDWPFLVLHAMHGKIGYLDECWSTYRQHPAGIYSRLSHGKRMEENLQAVRLYRDVMDPDYEELLTRSVSSRCLMLALHYQKAGNRTLSDEYAKIAVQEGDRRWLRRWRNRLKVYTYMRAPSLYQFVCNRRQHRG